MGFECLEALIRNEVAKSPQMLETVEKFPKDYENKVRYMEDPSYFNDWYGFLYLENESQKTFAMEKNLQGCLGHKVVNQDVAYSTRAKGANKA